MAYGVSGVFNLGSGTQITINHLAELIDETGDLAPTVNYAPPRPGDVRDSLADISAARAVLGFEPTISIKQGLRQYIAWAKEEGHEAAEW